MKYSAHADLILPVLLSSLSSEIDIDTDLCVPRKHCKKKVKSLQLLSGVWKRKQYDVFFKNLITNIPGIQILANFDEGMI